MPADLCLCPGLSDRRLALVSSSVIHGFVHDSFPTLCVCDPIRLSSISFLVFHSPPAFAVLIPPLFYMFRYPLSPRHSSYLRRPSSAPPLSAAGSQLPASTIPTAPAVRSSPEQRTACRADGPWTTCDTAGNQPTASLTGKHTSASLSDTTP